MFHAPGSGHDTDPVDLVSSPPVSGDGDGISDANSGGSVFGEDDDSSTPPDSLVADEALESQRLAMISAVSILRSYPEFSSEYPLLDRIATIFSDSDVAQARSTSLIAKLEDIHRSILGIPHRGDRTQQDDATPPPPTPPPQLTTYERASVDMLAGITRLLERQSERSGSRTRRMWLSGSASRDPRSLLGEIHVLGVTTLALLDSGATHSFVSSTFTQRMGIIPESLGAALSVMVPSGEELTTISVVQGLTMTFHDHAVIVELDRFSEVRIRPHPRYGLVDRVWSGDRLSAEDSDYQAAMVGGLII
ncbi:hypothetical protein F511_35199 [Dorcoceras hygrometricum]|uniref:Uncharacterized protein n=1 Tax=Dorcoceras hygrometricum TaxID=472368 RepID=A0A2Z7CW07_9LAMI|nr:hypothetical protein F511_35199 [Dorcoceras hygrometricum]